MTLPDITLSARLTRAIQRGGVDILGVSVGNPLDRLSWWISFKPGTSAVDQQTAATILAAYDPTAPDPVFDDEQENGAVTAALDVERLTSAVVWTILDTYSAPATVTKYQAARTKIINAYKVQPWKS